jgi:hypothetical protein
MAPHLGHLIFASFATPAHPKEKTANIANAKKILTHFLITIHLLSSIDNELFILIETSSKNPDVDTVGEFSKKFILLSREK